MESPQIDYFLARFRGLDAEGFAATLKRSDLSDEAFAAVRQVATERGLPEPSSKDPPDGASRGISQEELAVQSQLSSDLWNGSLSNEFSFSLVLSGSYSLVPCLGPRVFGQVPCGY